MKVTCFDVFGNPHQVDSLEVVDSVRSYGLVIQDRSILMVKDAFSGFWELPGGGVEGEESIVEGLAREFQEETGLTISDQMIEIDRFEEYFLTKESEAWHSRRFFYVVEVIGGILSPLDPKEISEVKYINIDELRNLKIKPRIREVLRKAYLK